MTILISSLAGGGSAKKISTAFNGGNIPIGTTADVTISCPAEKYIKLVFFGVVANNTQSGVSLEVGGRTIFTSKTIAEDQVSYQKFRIGLAGSGTGNGQTTSFLQGGRNEDFVFSFNSATIREIDYVYEVLEDA